MWHASGRAANWVVAEAIAFRALGAVGDPKLGQWVEKGRKYFVHVRRRLTPEEAAQVNEVRDIRGTPEEEERLRALAIAAPYLDGYRAE